MALSKDEQRLQQDELSSSLDPSHSSFSEKWGMSVPNFVALMFMIFGSMLSGFSQTGMNTMLPSIVSEFGIPVATGQWLVTIYLLCLGVTMPVVAFLSCKVSSRHLYLGAVTLFMAGALVMLFSHRFALILIGRMMQGCAAGTMLPLTQVVALAQVPVRKQGTIMGFIGLAMGFAPNIGPTIGGALESSFGWRSFLWFLLAFTAVVCVACFFSIRKQEPIGGNERKLDALSLGLSTLGFGGVLLGISNASSVGLTHAWCWGPALGGLAILAIFAVRQLRIPNPLLDLHVFAYKEMAVGTVAVCLLFFAFIGVTLVITLELQVLHGYSSLYAGMVLLPSTLSALIMNPVSGALLDRFGPRPVCLFGAVLTAFGTFIMLHLSSMDSLVFVAFLQTVRAIGIQSLIMPLTTWSIASLPRPLMPDGTSVSNALRQISAAFGTSSMVLLMAGGATDGSVTAAGVDGAMLLSFIVVVAMAVLCFIFVRAKAKPEEQ